MVLVRDFGVVFPLASVLFHVFLGGISEHLGGDRGREETVRLVHYLNKEKVRIIRRGTYLDVLVDRYGAVVDGCPHILKGSGGHLLKTTSQDTVGIS